LLTIKYKSSKELVTVSLATTWVMDVAIVPAARIL